MVSEEPNPFPRGSKGNILVVDDEEHLRQAMEEVLREHGYGVASCQHGSAAVAFYGKHHDKIDLILLDMLMPGMTGLDTFHSFRAVNPDVRAVLVSGYVPSQDVKDVREHGFLDFLHKPFQASQLLEVVRRNIAR